MAESIPLVMYVEDAEDLRESFRDLLECEGLRVVTAGDGEEALRLLGAGVRPCLVIADMMLPKLSGSGLIRAMGAHADYSRIPVMVLTGGIYRGSIADLPADVPVYEKPGGVHTVTQLLDAVRKFTQAARGAPSDGDDDEPPTIPTRTLS